MEEDMSNIMIRTASITHEGGATILNRVEAGVIKEDGARITNRKGAGILKEGGARIINRNGRVTGPMVEEVKVTESTTTIKIASRDGMTDIKVRTEKGDKTAMEAMEAVEGMKTQWFFCPKNCHLYLGTELRKWDSK